MSKNLKKILVTGASLLMFASVGVGLNSSNVHANGIGTDGARTTDVYGTPRKIERWNHVLGADEDQYASSFNNALGGGINANFRTGRAKTVIRYGHRITVVPEDDVPGKIIRVDGHRVYTPSQVLARLHKHSHRRYVRHHARKHYRRPVKKAKKHVAKRHIRKSHKITKRRASSKRTMIAKRTYFKYEHAIHPKMAIKAINFYKVSWKQINNWNSKIKKVQNKRRNKRARKTTVHKFRKNKTSRKVAKFRKSAYYHNMWTNALKMNQKQVSHELKEAIKYSKNGNMKANKKANQKANYFKRFVKHDQEMLNLGSK